MLTHKLHGASERTLAYILDIEKVFLSRQKKINANNGLLHYVYIGPTVKQDTIRYIKYHMREGPMDSACGNVSQAGICLLTI